MNKSTTPGSSSDKKPTSGKKLIQARLPFKVLSSSAEISSSSLESRKRKLSYSSDDVVTTPKQTKQLKENLDSVESDSIVISDNESLSESEKNNQSNTQKISVDEMLNQNVHNKSLSTSSKRNKLIIKLPLGSNKKRKKSKNSIRNQIDETESSDPEILTEERNRLKKTKINENDSSTYIDDEIDKKQYLDKLRNDESEKDQIDIDVQILSTSKTEINISSGEFKKSTDNKGNTPTNEVVIINLKDPEEEVDNKNKNEIMSISSVNNKCKVDTIIQPDTHELLSIEENKSDIKTDEINKNNETEGAAILSPNKSQEPTFQECTPKQSSLEENKSAIAKIVEKIQNKSNFKKIDIEKPKKKEIEEQKRKEKEDQRRKEKEEKEELKRKEKEEKEELKRKEKEEREELKRKEKEDREKKRLAELEVKTEEKRQKEDEKRKKEEQREEERRKRDDEKRKKELEKEEAEYKKRKAAEAFTKFFQTKKSVSKINAENEQNSGDYSNLEYRAFMPFQVKGDMKLAPSIRKEFSDVNKNNLDAIITDKCQLPVTKLYLNLLKTRQHLPCKSDNVKDDDADDVMIIDLLGQSIKEVGKLDQTYRAKYFQFKENRRPPYYGTWRKKSTIIGPRKPFLEDKLCFDYDVDSDDEWEEEEPGESLHGSDDEKESEDEYEVDNEFFVPHGHLSDEEMQNEDETEQDNSPECQKAKLKLLQQEFAKEMKKKTEKIRPRLLGIIWVDANGNQPDNCPNIIWESLNKCAMILCTDSPLTIESENKFLEAGTSILQDNKKSKRNELPEELTLDLIRLVHGNRHKKKFLIHEFQEFVSEKFKLEENPIKYSKAVIREKIDKISDWKVFEDKESKHKKKRLCWMVSPEILSLFGLENMSDKNDWNYILPPITKLLTTSGENLPNTKNKLNDNKTDNQNIQPKQSEDIKKFTKIISKDEKFPTLIKSENKNINTVNILRDSLVSGQEAFKKCEDGTISTDEKLPIEIYATNSDIVMKDISVSGDELSKVAKFQSVIPAQSNNEISKNVDKDTPAIAKPFVKKRVPLLMSVPRGQAIPETFKNELRDSFIKRNKDKVVTISNDNEFVSVTTTQHNDINSENVVKNTLVSGEQLSKVEKLPITKITTESDNKIKKRVPLLLSVPRGQAIPETFKNEVITSYLNKEKKECITGTTTVSETSKNQCPDSVIVIE